MHTFKSASAAVLGLMLELHEKNPDLLKQVTLPELRALAYLEKELAFGPTDKFFYTSLAHQHEIRSFQPNPIWPDVNELALLLSKHKWELKPQDGENSHRYSLISNEGGTHLQGKITPRETLHIIWEYQVTDYEEVTYFPKLYLGDRDISHGGLGFSTTTLISILGGEKEVASLPCL
jgi:hypothetical protein